MLMLLVFGARIASMAAPLSVLFAAICTNATVGTRSATFHVCLLPLTRIAEIPPDSPAPL
jgi:hypothetical protein